MESNPKSEKAASSLASRSVTVRENRLDSHDIFAGTREVTILHGEELYRLRLTAQNKLILTK
jgi:hemin uptake protein HemP